MNLSFNKEGLLSPGIHEVSWEVIKDTFGFNKHRMKLLKGLDNALIMLKKAGCKQFYLDGSFVTKKEFPRDYDACWDVDGVDATLVDPAFFNFENNRMLQKAKYYGEFFPVNMKEKNSGKLFLDFFQIDRESGNKKGIVRLTLR